MPEVDLSIAGRPYRVACRTGEEDSLRAAAALVDSKSREALAGLGALSEARQLLFASLLLADQMIEGRPEAAAPAPVPEPAAQTIAPELADKAERIARRLESLAEALERDAAHP